MVINPIVGVYIPIIRIPIKGGMTIPNIATLDHGTHGKLTAQVVVGEIPLHESAMCSEKIGINCSCFSVEDIELSKWWYLEDHSNYFQPYVVN